MVTNAPRPTLARRRWRHGVTIAPHRRWRRRHAAAVRLGARVRASSALYGGRCRLLQPDGLACATLAEMQPRQYA